MSLESRVSVRRSVLIAAGTGLLAIGAGAGYVVFAASRSSESATHAERPMPPASAPAPSASRVATVIAVPMSKEARTRAGVAVAAVAGGAASGQALRAPGIVEPNAYKRVAVTPIVAGRVIGNLPELGARVVRGQTIARIYSPELAEAQASYVSARAELDAHDRELTRTEKLVQIGSASRQELERVSAEHTARRTAVQSASSRLRLLGLSTEAIDHLEAGHATDATLAVPAPLTGIVTERTANIGLNVDASTSLATIVDLSSVWVVADVYESDFSRVRVGTAATVTTTAYPQLALAGRVSYIDPQVNAQTRTAKVRVEVPNARQELRLGMLAEASFAGAASGTTALVVPRRAVQSLADRTVVYVVNPENDAEFLERPVRLGEPTGDTVAVLAGLQPGDVVVTDGSFHVRAERERLGLGAPGPTPDLPSMTMQTPSTGEPQTAKVTVTKDGFDPAKVTLKAGKVAKLTFLKTTDQTCASEVAFPSLKIKKPLPLNKPVVIEFTPEKAGEIEFACGMGMLKGTVVVEPGD